MKALHEVLERKYGDSPERVLQFGEGNFLRGFADWMIDCANSESGADGEKAAGAYEGSIVLCQPIRQGMGEIINRQKGMYTLLMRGRENGVAREEAAVISSVSRCINPYEDYDALLAIARSPELQVIISNTTEAGIAWQDGCALTDAPPASYPAKLTAFLYERYTAFGGSAESRLLVLPVELIDDNGSTLRHLVRRHAEEWQLPEGFLAWLEKHVSFANTLVDRIVTGYPREDIAAIEAGLGYTDDLLVTSELFNLWVIEADAAWGDVLPVGRANPDASSKPSGGVRANVIWTDNAAPYKKRKVRILNGGHTSMVLAGYLAGHDTVLDCMQDATFREYLRRLLFDEVIPTLDLPREDLEDFARSVIDRFDNPYIRHRLLDISLNSCSKFAARCVPSLLAYREATQKLPDLLVFSLAAFMAFYRGTLRDGTYTGVRPDGTVYEIRDDAQVLAFFDSLWNGPVGKDPQALVAAVLARSDFWNGQSLLDVPGLVEQTAAHLRQILEQGDMRRSVAALLQ
ncbi:tagaturonate reductase [Desulfovibrio sp. OttesenSCG-928-I05]|nr:tagaturonate reductase [Desulfovibrio sp. OttesenSCG-928-I05]